eukprot:scaffold100_cov357-Prasinococcus_capsulatus_cf.AAC.26
MEGSGPAVPPPPPPPPRPFNDSNHPSNSLQPSAPPPGSRRAPVPKAPEIDREKVRDGRTAPPAQLYVPAAAAGVPKGGRGARAGGVRPARGAGAGGRAADIYLAGRLAAGADGAGQGGAARRAPPRGAPAVCAGLPRPPGPPHAPAAGHRARRARQALRGRAPHPPLPPVPGNSTPAPASCFPLLRSAGGRARGADLPAAGSAPRCNAHPRAPSSVLPVAHDRWPPRLLLLWARMLRAQTGDFMDVAILTS